MLFLVVTWVAWAAAQSSNFLNISSAVSGQSQLTHFATYLGLFPTLVTQIDAGNITGNGHILRYGKDTFALMEIDESLSTFR